MKILFVTPFEATSIWAHAINNVKMAQGFASLGHDVTIVCRAPRSKRLSNKELKEYYGLTEEIRWVQLPHRMLFFKTGRFWLFATLVLPLALIIRPDMVFARNYTFPCISSMIGIPTVAETHAHTDHDSRPFLKMIGATRRSAFKRLVTISGTLADHYIGLGVPRGKIAVLPTGADVTLFERPDRLPENPFSQKGPIASYMGHLYDWKGIPAILGAARLLNDVRFHLIGGFEEDVKRQKKRIAEMGLENVTIHGRKLQKDLPPYLWHSDVLLLPPSLDHPSSRWTSPVKLGEFFASGTPVVATSIPALVDWLEGDEVEFVTPDDPEDMARGIRKVLGDRKLAKSLSENALKKAREWSYSNRAEVVLKGIQNTEE